VTAVEGTAWIRVLWEIFAYCSSDIFFLYHLKAIAAVAY